MVNRYFHTFGFAVNDKNWLISELSDLLGVKFESHSGEKYVYILGEIGNRVSVFYNYLEEDDWWQESEYKEFPILVKMSLVNLNQMHEFNRLKSKLDQLDFYRFQIC